MLSFSSSAVFSEFLVSILSICMLSFWSSALFSSLLVYWKACEFRAWLLFYSLPILQFYLPSEYIHHWSLLVHALLSNNLPKLVLPLVSDSLQQVNSLTPQLYGTESLTANLHSIIHLTKEVMIMQTIFPIFEKLRWIWTDLDKVCGNSHCCKSLIDWNVNIYNCK